MIRLEDIILNKSLPLSCRNQYQTHQKCNTHMKVASHAVPQYFLPALVVLLQRFCQIEGDPEVRVFSVRQGS